MSNPGLTVEEREILSAVATVHGAAFFDVADVPAVYREVAADRIINVLENLRSMGFVELALHIEASSPTVTVNGGRLEAVITDKGREAVAEYENRR
jgi:hypothetical protein